MLPPRGPMPTFQVFKNSGKIKLWPFSYRPRYIWVYGCALILASCLFTMYGKERNVAIAKGLDIPLYIFFEIWIDVFVGCWVRSLLKSMTFVVLDWMYVYERVVSLWLWCLLWRLKIFACGVHKIMHHTSTAQSYILILFKKLLFRQACVRIFSSSIA